MDFVVFFYIKEENKELEHLLKMLLNFYNSIPLVLFKINKEKLFIWKEISIIIMLMLIKYLNSKLLIKLI
jgi:hypothetical protein